VFHNFIHKIFRKLKSSLTRGISVFIWNTIWFAVNIGLFSFFEAFRQQVSAKYALLSNPISAFCVFLDGTRYEKYLPFTYMLHGTIVIACLILLTRKIVGDYSESKELRRKLLFEPIPDATSNDG
jgi:hypothetical protein